MLWTARYLDAAVTTLRELSPERRDFDVLDTNVARLSPLTRTSLNVRGRYSCRANGARPRVAALRDPTSAGDEE